MDIASLLAQGVQTRPAGMQQNALMQAQEFKQRQQQNALMQMQMQAAQEKRAQDQQNALMQQNFINSIPSPQMQASQAALASGGGPTVANAAQMKPVDPRTQMLHDAMRARMVSPVDYINAANPKDEFVTMKPGESRINTRTNQPVFTAPTEPKAPDAPNAVREYQFAVSQGYKGTFEQWDTTRKRAGATNVSVGEKPPAGYKWNATGGLDPIPGGPADKLPEKQQNTVIGAQNVRAAIADYRSALSNFSKWDTLKPDERAKMGTKYNNMMLQAKEAYNLGVLNGPDLEILTSVITDPRSLSGAMTSKTALDTQAAELDRIMQGIADVASQPRPRGSEAKPSQAAPKAGAVLNFDANGNPVK